MEVSALKNSALPGLRGPTPLLRLQSDERLVAMVRRGQQSAFEALVSRYEARLLAFCRHMLNSREDAEDVLQEVFAAAFNALLADEREINVRPWLYRIARNRSLNHLRRATAIGVDSMDIHLADHGLSTGEKVFKRESFRELIADVQQLPETQRTALLLREIDALSYEQISDAMETTVPSVKSLLVRARISLAEAAEARKLTCEEVRLQLGEVAEGIAKLTPPARRHVKRCDRCGAFRTHLRANNRALAAIFPVGPLLIFKKLLLAKLGTTAGAGHVAGGATAAGAMSTAGGAVTTTGAAGIVGGAIATKAVAGLTAAALVTAGAVEIDHRIVQPRHHAAIAAAPLVHRATAPVAIRSQAQPVTSTPRPRPAVKPVVKPKPTVVASVKPPTVVKPPVVPVATPVVAPHPPVATTPTVQEVQSETTVLPSATPPTTTTASPTTTAAPPPPTTTTQAPPPPPPTTSTSTSPSGPSPSLPPQH